METLNSIITNKITSNQGKIFSIHDFYDLGKKNTVKSILYRLYEENKIVRLVDGLYTAPKYSNILKEVSYPTATEVAYKIADKFSWTITPTGELALNITGLSTQVPNEYIFVSDGPYREYMYRNKKIIFKHTTNRNITNFSYELAILIQAIRALGKENINDSNLKKLSDFRKIVKEDFNKSILKLPFWIQEVLKKIEA
ncbi:DUF6088 family protein [Veillonella criceti]|uniref:Transcriptional regulator, AbiEi antitoxin, Type IV TA system n=1 Tax=Veillonella criceti TaxID=103891 RepID=A0A380NIA7_9FIRM|nr:DUF6088 family protein [Veillonella criceti]SUP41023.1 Uncharacterised protein [Veillonella criceti]